MLILLEGEHYHGSDRHHSDRRVCLLISYQLLPWPNGDNLDAL